MRLLRRHPIISFFVLAYVFGWIFSIPNILDQLRLLPFSLPTFAGSFLFMLAPVTSALIVTGATGGKAAIQALLRRMTIWRVNFWWYVVVLFVPPLIQIAAQTAFVPFGGPGPHLDTSAFSLIPLLPVLYFAAMCEEIGWRGFALPRLQTRFNALVSASLLGVLWGLWHLPPTVPEFIQGSMTVPGFFLSIIPLVGASIVMAWIFNNTKGSLLLVALFHSSYDIRGHFFPIVWQSGSFGPTQLSEIGMIVLALVIVLLVQPQNLSRKGTRVQTPLPSALGENSVQASQA